MILMDYISSYTNLQYTIKETSSLEKQASLLLTYCCHNKIKYWKECEPIARRALEIAEQLNHKEFKGLALLEIGYQLWFSDKPKEAFNYLTESNILLKESGNYFKFSRALAVQSSILWSKGDRKDAIVNIFNGLRTTKLMGEKQDSLWLEWFLGIFYFDLKDYENAEKQYKKCLSIIPKSTTNIRDAHAYCLIGYAGVLLQTNRADEALDYFLKAQQFCETHSLWMQEARVLNDLGSYYYSKHEYDQASLYYTKSYKIRLKQNTKPALITTMLALSEIDSINKDHEKALELVNTALGYSKDINSTPKLIACHKRLSKIHKDLKQIEQSIFHIEQENKLDQLISGHKVNSELKNIETQFITEYLEQERKTLALQNKELKRANEIIKKQYEEISDSIRYAKRIQTAILPAIELVKTHLSQSFILYIPKDIVAGDFYWMETIKDKVIFAVADCTGHGVPGAMISVVCNNALNRSVREFKLTKPHEILDKVRDIIISEFKNEKDFSDGMDISLCTLDKSTNHLEWSGANSPLWLIRENGNSIEEFKANNEPIGSYPLKTPFTLHDIHLNTGDQIYLFSDGYTDQFGGPNDKKFMKNKFRSLLLASKELSLEAQKQALINTYLEWKGTYEQIDDICIFGIKI